jgi:hypothetical protein
VIEPDGLPEVPGQGPGSSGPWRRRRWESSAAWIHTHPGLTLVLVLPPVLFLAPQLVGRVFLDGDNYIQNFPLRVMVAHDLQHGSLPLMNPYLFSGTPLLAGFNAGAAYPATWLLAVLPSFEAWSLNLAIAYDVALLGTYLFLRRQSLSSTAATFAAVTFAFAGYMSGQIVHIDLIEGAAWLPWTLLAVDSLLPARVGVIGAPVVQDRGTRSWARWGVLLAVTVGLTVLTGGAEAIVDGLVGVVLYALWQLVSQGRRGVGLGAVVTSAAWMIGGLTVGVALGTAQWYPGLVFTSESQRATTSYPYFVTGSLNYHLLVLLVSPFVLGTNQNHPTLYIGQYNLPEVTYYVGILALIAGTTLWSRRFRARPEARVWRVWYALGIFGMLSALGGETPFGRVLFLVPIIRDERLLNRNLLLVDFALAVLLGWWVHVLFDRQPTGSPEPKDRVGGRSTIRTRWARAIRWAPGRRAEILLSCAPAAIIVIITAAFWIDGALVLRLLDAIAGLSTTRRLGLAGVVTLGAVVAVGATVIVLLERRLQLASLRRWLAAVLVADLLWLTVFVLQVPITETNALAKTPPASALSRATAGGRFVIYDPDQFEDGQLLALGQTDLNVFRATASGQGYTALTDGAYVRATGAHYQEDLDPASLRGPVWDNLDATTLLSLPSYFVTPLGPPPAGATVPFPTYPSAERHDYTGAPLDTDAPVVLAPGHTHTWYLGAALSVSRWSVGFERGRSGDVQAGEVTATGALRWIGSTSSAGATTLRAVPAGGPIAGIVVRNRSRRPVVLRVPEATASETGPVALDGRMQYGVYPAHWRFVGDLGSFGVFDNTRARGLAWATGPTGGAPAAATTVVARAASPTGLQRVTVRSAAAVDLVRSMSWSPGWQATAKRLGRGAAGPARRVEVTADGLIQQVALPAGDWTVTFTYRPDSAVVALVVSAVVGALLVIWLLLDAALGAARRRRRQCRRAPAAAG